MYQKFQTVVKLEKKMNEQKVQTLLNNSLEIFKQGQEMEIQVLTTGIAFVKNTSKCRKHCRF